jgi:hypothetical protein
VAPDLIASPTPGAAGVEPARVSPKEAPGRSNSDARGRRGPCFERRTSVNVTDGVNELTDGAVRSLNATTEGGNVVHIGNPAKIKA